MSNTELLSKYKKDLADLIKYEPKYYGPENDAFEKKKKALQSKINKLSGSKKTDFEKFEDGDTTSLPGVYEESKNIKNIKTILEALEKTVLKESEFEDTFLLNDDRGIETFVSFADDGVLIKQNKNSIFLSTKQLNELFKKFK